MMRAQLCHKQNNDWCLWHCLIVSNAAALNDIYVLQFEKGNFSILSFKICMLSHSHFKHCNKKTSSLNMLKNCWP